MTMMPEDAVAPDLDLMLGLACEAVMALPEAFRAAALAVVLRVEEFPPDDVLESLDIEDAYDLTGFYDGIPMTQKSASDPAPGPDVVWLFRRPILDEWIERGDVTLADLVGHVVVHEFAHHFGWSDAEIARIDRWWE